MEIIKNAIWPRTEDTLKPIGEVVIEIPSVTVGEYFALHLGSIFANCPYPQYAGNYEKVWTLNRGKKFVAEIYEVVASGWTSPWVYEMIAKYRERKLLGIIGAMAFAVQENEKFWQMIRDKIWCLAPYDYDVLKLDRPREDDDQEKEPIISYQHVMGSLTAGDSVIFYRDFVA